MKLRDMMIHNYGGFELDTDKIGNTSISKDEIRLPYNGDLPTPYDIATIAFRITPENVNVILETQTDKRKPIRYIVLASREEVDRILWPFFWAEVTETKFHTRSDNGLTEYWNGHYQAEFMEWHNIGITPVNICKILQQLTKDQRDSLYRRFEKMEREEATEG